MCGVGQVRLCMCVSYEERRVAVGLPDSECVVLGRSVYVCVSYEECRVAVGLLERLSSWCSAGPSVYVCVIRGMPSSCRSAAESECGFGQVRLCVCVCRTLNAGSCRSAGESECVVLGRSVCMCVCLTRNAE